jgi:hypothetical protein
MVQINNKNERKYMPSAKELAGLFNEGKLGEFLAHRFTGQRGHVYPRKDSDFLVVFESEKTTPLIESVRDAVIGFYTEMGYTIIPDTFQAKDSFQANVRYQDDDRVVALLNITTKYPFDHRLVSLRVTTELLV